MQVLMTKKRGLSEAKTMAICELYVQKEGNIHYTDARKVIGPGSVTGDVQLSYLRNAMRENDAVVKRIMANQVYDTPSQYVVDVAVLLRLLQRKEEQAKRLESIAGKEASQHIYDAARNSIEKVAVDSQWHPAALW